VAGSFHCTLVTPDRQILDEQIAYANVPAWDGGLGIAPDHAPLLVRLGIGPLRIDLPDGATRWYLVVGGYAQMVGNHPTMLSTRATAAEKLVESEATAELQQAMGLPATTDDQAEEREDALLTARTKRSLARTAAGAR